MSALFRQAAGPPLSLCLSFSFSPLRGRRQCRRRRRHKITFHHFSSFFTQNFQTKTNETVSPEAFKKIPEKLSREAEKKDLNGNCGNFQVCDLEQPKVCGRLSAINIFGSLPERWNIQSMHHLQSSMVSSQPNPFHYFHYVLIFFKAHNILTLYRC